MFEAATPATRNMTRNRRVFIFCVVNNIFLIYIIKILFYPFILLGGI